MLNMDFFVGTASRLGHGVVTGGRGRRACGRQILPKKSVSDTSDTQVYWSVLRMVPCLSQDALSGTTKNKVES